MRRITPVPYDPAAPVWTSWDLGIRDATAIWFAQVIGREIRIIDLYEEPDVKGANGEPVVTRVLTIMLAEEY